MATEKFVFEEKHHIIEIDGIEYEIPQRTQFIEDELKKRDEEMAGLSEFENNIRVLEILFGKENAEKMFPDKESTNLDKLLKCVNFSLALYRTESFNIKNEPMKKDIQEVKDTLRGFQDEVKNFSNAVNSIQKKNSNAKRPRKRK